jgi:FMN phosphatase YigB (HAD superfamily)
MQDRSTETPKSSAAPPETYPIQSPPDLKGLLFDAGDVIYRRRRDPPAFAAFLSENGLRSPAYDAPELKSLKREAHAGSISRDAFFDAVLEHCGPMSPEQVERGRAILAAAQGEIDFFTGVPETLWRLKHAGFRLGIVTNTFDATATKLQWFRRVGIDTVWDSFATSCELKLLKPAPGLYLAALAPLDLYPGQVAFVGHAQGELQGAKSLGMTTIAFNRDSDAVAADYVIHRFSELLEFIRD